MLVFPLLQWFSQLLTKGTLSLFAPRLDIGHANLNLDDCCVQSTMQNNCRQCLASVGKNLFLSDMRLKSV